MTELRLNKLALMKINRHVCEDIQRSPEKIRHLVQLFAQQHPKRMQLLFILAD